MMKPILIVEDEAILRESLRDWLSDNGYQVETAGEGKEALKTLATQDFGMVILDLRLPDKSGLDVLREAKADKPELKGIIITAYPSLQTAVEAMKLGIVNYLPKPFDLNELEVLLRESLRPVQVQIKPGDAVPAEDKASETATAPEQKADGRARVEEVVDQATGRICLPPCQIACPIGEDIQRTNTMLAYLPPDAQAAACQIIKIGDELYESNPLFAICGYICGLCERRCNYQQESGAIRRRLLERFVAERYLPHLKNKAPLPGPALEKVAVVGGGPAGLMCAYTLSKKGYAVTLFERSSELGGALRYVPRYHLPRDVLDITVKDLVRMAHIDVQFGAVFGANGKTLNSLKREGYRAVFIATGTHLSKPLAIEGQAVPGTDLEGVGFGLSLLSDINQGRLSLQLLRRLFRDKRVIVAGGSNEAFDAARSVRRLGALVSLVCLECDDKTSSDGIPADMEEVEGAVQEGIRIHYSRGVEEIIGEGGRFKKARCVRCVSVFDESGFNPKFDHSDSIEIEGDVLLVATGRNLERAFYQRENLLDGRGRLDINKVTLMANRRDGVFVGGEVRRPTFAAEAMRDGIVAAESIDRYLRGEDLKSGREKPYEEAALPSPIEYKPQPGLIWTPSEERRLNFELFEKGFTLEEAVAEAKRCLRCGPCRSCKACIALGLRPELPRIEVNQPACSSCGTCVVAYPSSARTGGEPLIQT